MGSYLDSSKLNTPPIVSVIIPTFNRWPVVGEAVESVLAQSFKDFELIVVDDGSNDWTTEKINALGRDPSTRAPALAGGSGSGFRPTGLPVGLHIRIIAQARRGVSAARNRGARVARGRYLAFLDSDDLWLPEKLAVQTTFMETHSEMQICQTEEIWLRRGVRVNPKAKHRKPSGDIFRPSLELCLVSPSAVMMTKQLFEDMGGFDESLPVCEDYDLWLRVAVDHSVPLIGARLVIKRGGHADQLSRSTWGMDRYRVAALQKLLRAGVSGEKRVWVIDALERKITVLAQGARKRGKAEQASAYESALEVFTQKRKDVRAGDSRVRQREGVSRANIGAVARLERAG